MPDTMMSQKHMVLSISGRMANTSVKYCQRGETKVSDLSE